MRHHKYRSPATDFDNQFVNWGEINAHYFRVFFYYYDFILNWDDLKAFAFYGIRFIEVYRKTK